MKIQVTATEELVITLLSMYYARVANHRGFPRQMQRLKHLFKPAQTLLILSICTLVISGCSTFRFPGVFRIDVGQGNIITAEMIEKLKVGMTKRQVEYVMGSAMIKDPFSPNRWDYIYNFETGRGTFVENRLTLYFEKSRLQRIDDERLEDPEAVRQKLEDGIKEERS